MERKCSRCHQLKPVDEFHRRDRPTASVFLMCVTCRDINNRPRKRKRDSTDALLTPEKPRESPAKGVSQPQPSTSSVRSASQGAITSQASLTHQEPAFTSLQPQDVTLSAPAQVIVSPPDSAQSTNRRCWVCHRRLSLEHFRYRLNPSRLSYKCQDCREHTSHLARARVQRKKAEEKQQESL
ncbi:uncharacterized protein N7479_003068 [Penicillium vulpinum]|uniref:Uncharacterized protein n=1 Tax=Penicillium vulpinum TaxID=29845 RepID=A0A1V6R0P1_9EURO|nr:uncharacterized protein N7479_003068 [Penicillium vulpinum]KAJ5973150.1 hypothetical protein N7479_003068 [Penicillium vulpinum]OQD94806.1 hypothetical protein PENVUL_c130G09935 [Penicillium vulpinum]